MGATGARRFRVYRPPGVKIGERLPDNRLGGIFVADSREEGANLIYYAKSGSVVEKGDEKGHAAALKILDSFRAP